MLLTLLKLAMKLSASYGSVGRSLIEKKSKEKVFEMRVSVGKELTECGIFTFWRRDRERHVGAVTLMIMSILLTGIKTRVMMWICNECARNVEQPTSSKPALPRN